VLSRIEILLFLINANLGAPFGDSERELINSYDSRLPGPPQLLFLGLDESDKGSRFVYGEDHVASRYEGRPYFAVGVGEWRPEGVQGEWSKTQLVLKLVREDAAILVQARSLMDWNNRNAAHYVLDGGCEQCLTLRLFLPYLSLVREIKFP
jgi:hypothetical protein